MKISNYLMPTVIVYGSGCIVENSNLFSGFGSKAFIVTGKSSEKNGSLNDVLTALKSYGRQYVIFNEVEENPSIECVYGAAQKGISEKCDFLVGVGGGSSIDAAKSIAVLMRNPALKGEDLYNSQIYDALPVIAVPTTAGTGAEVTPNAVLTNRALGIKASTPQRVFPHMAFLDGGYLAGMPYDLMASTVIDALCHLSESFLSTKSTYLSDRICESAFEAFGRIKGCLTDKQFTAEINNELILIASMGGMAIGQTTTSIPHYLSYQLTYKKNIPHGRACGLLLYEYLNSFANKDKVNIMVEKLGFGSLDELGEYIRGALHRNDDISEKDIDEFVANAMKKPDKLNSYPGGANAELIKEIYTKSLLKTV